MVAIKKQRLTVNLEAPEYQRLLKAAKRYDVSMAWLGRHAITRFLERNDGQPELPFPRPASDRPER